MTHARTAVLAILPTLLLTFLATALLGQESQGMPSGTLGSQTLRPYWHVFIAYTIAIVLVLGWVLSIGRRLRDVEERLGQG
jgi:CcmD family protein